MTIDFGHEGARQYDSFIQRTPVEALKVCVTPMTVADLTARIFNSSKLGENLTVGAHNLHSVYLAHTNPEFSDFYRYCDAIVVDGWPVLAALNYERRRNRQPELPSSYRIGSPDWIMAAICLPAVQKVCIVGAKTASNAAFIDIARRWSSETQFLGIPGDPWDEGSATQVAERIVKFAPDLTIVGMGMPLQEAVTTRLRDSGVGGVIATVGGAIDQLSGAQAWAPRWTGRYRVEWLWRLASNPRRLAKRYLVEPWKLVWLLVQRKQAA